jgi:hypothetical protein
MRRWIDDARAVVAKPEILELGKTLARVMEARDFARSKQGSRACKEQPKQASR